MLYKFISCLFLVLSLCINLQAQLGFGTGRIRGVIHDELKKPVAGANIEIINLTYNTKFTSVSDAQGRWSISGIASDWYKITVSKAGYHVTTTEYQLSLIGQRVHTLDITLRKEDPAIVPDTVEATSSALAATLQEGNELFNQRKYREALAKYEEFLKEKPETYQLFMNIGNCFQELKEYDQAISAYHKYIDRVKSEKGTLSGDRNASQALAATGNIYLEQKDLNKATEYFQLAIDTYPGDATLPFNLGEIFFSQGHSEQAVEYFLIAINMKKDWALPYLKLGYAYLNLGQYKESIESLKEFLKLAPDDPQASSVMDLLPKLEELIKK